MNVGIALPAAVPDIEHGDELERLADAGCDDVVLYACSGSSRPARILRDGRQPFARNEEPHHEHAR